MKKTNASGTAERHAEKGESHINNVGANTHRTRGKNSQSLTYRAHGEKGKKEMERKSFVLCPARHAHPQIDGLPSIFPTEIADVTDVGGLTEVAWNAVWGCAGVDLYVTGLTVAVGAVIRACYTLAVPLTLWHFDRAAGEYFPQLIITQQDAAMMREGGWYA